MKMVFGYTFLNATRCYLKEQFDTKEGRHLSEIQMKDEYISLFLGFLVLGS